MANKKRAEPVIRVTVGLDASDHKQLVRLAADADVSLAWMLRRAAQEFLATNYENKTPASVVLKQKCRVSK